MDTGTHRTGPFPWDEAHRALDTEPAATHHRLRISAAAPALLLWSACLVVLFVVNGQAPLFAFAVAGYAAYLAAVGAWLLPRTVPAEQEEVLRATAKGIRLAARCGIVLISIGLVYTDDLVTALPNEISAAVLAWLAWVRNIHLAPGLGGYELFNFAMYAFFPGLLLLALGARRRELGLCLPARRTILATLVCLIPVVSFVGWGVATGRLAPAVLFWLLMHNFFSNGLTEEFLCRGMILCHLRALFQTGWAQLGQAVAFALLHFHPAGTAEQASPWRSLAEDLALNLPVALAFGFLALRSRSLVLPTFLHMFRWLP